MNVFFSSDYHFYHFNIIKYCNRPFNNVEKMNKTIIDNHNSRVKENDTIIFLGDFGFFASKNKTNRGEGQPYNPDELLEQMNGHKWTFIKGNHDKHSNKLKTDIHYICINKKNLHIQCIHNPENANLNFDLILCGHVHNAWKAKEVQFNNKKILFINVSVDVWNFYPIRFDEILSIYYKWKHIENKKEYIKELNKGTCYAQEKQN